MLTNVLTAARMAGTTVLGPGLRLALGLALIGAPGCRGGEAEAPDPTAGESIHDPSDPSDPSDASDPSEATASAQTEHEAPPPRPEEPRPPTSIYRSELVRATSFGPAYLLRELGPEPFRHRGTFMGWEITRVFPSDPGLCAPGCDLQVGDVVLSVNGSKLETPQQLSDALDAVAEATKLEVVTLRGEKRRQVTYAIVEDL